MSDSKWSGPIMDAPALTAAFVLPSLGPFEVHTLSSFKMRPLAVTRLKVSRTDFSTSQVGLIGVGVPLHNVPSLKFGEHFIRPAVSLCVSAHSGSYEELFSSWSTPMRLILALLGSGFMVS